MNSTPTDTSETSAPSDTAATSKPHTQKPTTCPDCGSADYSHEWTDAHKILRATCCGKLYRVLPGNQLEAVASEPATH